MNPDEYVALLRGVLTSNPYIAVFQLHTEQRGESFLYLHGKAEFLHGGTLDFREFLEFHADEVEKYAYAYNYRVREQVVFRYDNAPDPRSKHLPTYPAHKHLGDELVPSGRPDLMAVIREVLQRDVGTE